MLKRLFAVIVVAMVAIWSAALAIDAAPQRENAPCRPNASPASSGQPSGRHAYFDSLTARPDCLAAYSLRDPAELESLDTVNKTSPKKRPLVYDPVVDAAKLTIHAPTSTDIKGKMMPMHVATGSMLLTWEFRFSEEFRWKEGYAGRHKTWRVLPGPWLAIRTDYRHAARHGKFAELMITMPGKQFLGPGASRGAPGWFGEMLQPQRATFYFEPNNWVRVWVFVDGLDQPVCHLSVWAADEKRDPVQLYDKVALIPAKGGLKQFHIEYDTSRDQAKNPKEMFSWNRNVVILHNIPAGDIPKLLERPRP